MVSTGVKVWLLQSLVGRVFIQKYWCIYPPKTCQWSPLSHRARGCDLSTIICSLPKTESSVQGIISGCLIFFHVHASTLLRLRARPPPPLAPAQPSPAKTKWPESIIAYRHHRLLTSLRLLRWGGGPRKIEQSFQRPCSCPFLTHTRFTLWCIQIKAWSSSNLNQETSHLNR